MPTLEGGLGMALPSIQKKAVIKWKEANMVIEDGVLKSNLSEKSLYGRLQKYIQEETCKDWKTKIKPEKGVNNF